MSSHAPGIFLLLQIPRNTHQRAEAAQTDCKPLSRLINLHVNIFRVTFPLLVGLAYVYTFKIHFIEV